MIANIKNRIDYANVKLFTLGKRRSINVRVSKRDVVSFTFQEKNDRCFFHCCLVDPKHRTNDG